MLREFWFPALLALASVLPGFAAMHTEGNAKRVLWTLTAFIWFLAFGSYQWGDPVRGPFAKLIHPRSNDTFWLHAGVAVGFPVRKLSEGIDFSHVINLPGQPIELWIKRTWWSGWKYRVGLRSTSGTYVIKLTNTSIEQLPSGWEANFDNNAIEVVD